MLATFRGVSAEVATEPIEWRVIDPRRPNQPLGLIHRHGGLFEVVRGGDELGPFETFSAAVDAFAR